jgi:hypothetical protein
MNAAVQVHCPFCNAAQAPRADGNNFCDFCLQPFTVVDAKREEARLLEEIKSWLQQKVGAAGLTPGAVDASSRSFIFQQKILPELRRDVDRSLEVVGGFGQVALVTPPTGGVRLEPNPLVDARREILGLKALRARLSSESVNSFAIASSDRALVDLMDHRISEVMHLSNVADAAGRRSPLGYGSARKNLEALLDELQEALASGAGAERSLLSFLAATQKRYRALCELCRLSEEASGSQRITGAPLCARLDEIKVSLHEAATEIEASGHSPADAMPLVLGINQEIAAATVFARWLAAYDTLSSRVDIAFSAFITEIGPLLGGAGGELGADVLEAAGLAVRALRRETAVGVVGDFGWVDAWVEGQRAKKTFGLFGAEESVEALEKFLLPVWVAEVTFSKSAGAVFKAGVEGKGIAIVDACGPSAAKVQIFTDLTQPLPQAVLTEQPLPSASVALPRSTAALVQPLMLQALRARPELLNPQVRMKGMAFAAAAVVQLRSSKGGRELASCAAGQIAVDPASRSQVHAMQQLVQRLG